MDVRGQLEMEADQQLFMERRPGGCESIVQLSTREVATMWFDVLRSAKHFFEHKHIATCWHGAAALTVLADLHAADSAWTNTWTIQGAAE